MVSCPSDEAIFTYKVDNVYAPKFEASIRWNDEDIAIKLANRSTRCPDEEKDLRANSLKRRRTFD